MTSRLFLVVLQVDDLERAARYARDPWGNGLCFVDAATMFTGR